ncbi:MAG: hypothetical protein J7M14_03425 [Planctomycetes bacterium]|nr:hypothetical protein [Planctomycetota bacterium]
MSYVATCAPSRQCARLLACSAWAIILVAGDFALAQNPVHGKDRPKGPQGHRAAAMRPRERAARNGGPRRDDPARRGARLSDQQITKLLDSLKQYRPNLYERLMRLRTDDPREYRSALRSAWRWQSRLGWKNMPAAVKRAAVAEQQARVRIWRLVKQVRQASTTQQKQAAVAQLRQAVVERFKARSVLLSYRLERLEKEIQRLRTELKERGAQQQQIVAERVEQLLKRAAATRPAPLGRRRNSRRSTIQPAG